MIRIPFVRHQLNRKPKDPGIRQITPRTANAMYENGPSIQSSPITYQDLRKGDGDIIEEGKRVNIQWVLKRSNGYDIDSSSKT